MIRVHFMQDQNQLKSAIFQIRHLRPYNGQEIAQKGGHTVLAEIGAETAKSPLYTARCHPRDTFNRKMGVRQCLQRYVQRNMPGHVIENIASENGIYQVTIQ